MKPNLIISYQKAQYSLDIAEAQRNTGQPLWPQTYLTRLTEINYTPYFLLLFNIFHFWTQFGSFVLDRNSYHNSVNVPSSIISILALKKSATQTLHSRTTAFVISLTYLTDVRPKRSPNFQEHINIEIRRQSWQFMVTREQCPRRRCHPNRFGAFCQTPYFAARFRFHDTRPWFPLWEKWTNKKKKRRRVRLWTCSLVH